MNSKHYQRVWGMQLFLPPQGNRVRIGVVKEVIKGIKLARGE